MAYQKKYLKYKQKYSELKNNIIQQGGAKTYYDLTGNNIYFFSDEESGAPFKFKDSIYNEINTQLNEDFIFSNGIITDLKDNVSIGFLGDLIDNGKYSIRLLQSFIKLKTNYMDRVILIGGNRDFNKVRMGIELFYEDSEKQNLPEGLPWFGTNSIADLIIRTSNNKFQFREKKIPNYLQNVKLWDNIINNKSLENDYNNISTPFHTRLDSMFRKTKGIGGYKFIIEELNEILPGNNFVEDERSAKVICAIQMAMSFNWTELPSYLEQFNGLYYKYLELSHVIAVFKIDEKYGILSHSGMPQKTKKNPEKYLTYPFGYDYKNIDMGFKPDNLKNVIKYIEEEKIELLQQINNKKNNKYAFLLDDRIDKFVQLTAGTTYDNIYGASSTNSPVVWGQAIQTNEREDINLQMGGYFSWLYKDILKSDKIYAQQGETKISYNIFGHAPQLFNPTIFRDKYTLHINLDVSKIEANQGNNNSANNYSFAFFYINSSTKKEYILGRIEFPSIADEAKTFEMPSNTISEIIKSKSGKDMTELREKIYNGIAYLDSNSIEFIKLNKKFYYKHEIVEGSISISQRDNIIGTNLKCINYPPLDFTKYIWTV